MIVKWNEARLLTIGIPGKKAPAVYLKPGINVVPNEVWEIICMQATVDAKLVSKQLELVACTVKKSPEKGPGNKDTGNTNVTITSKEPWELEAAKAVVLVPDVLDVDLLEKWLDNEGRNEVRAKLSQQLDKMSK